MRQGRGSRAIATVTKRHIDAALSLGEHARVELRKFFKNGRGIDLQRPAHARRQRPHKNRIWQFFQPIRFQRL